MTRRILTGWRGGFKKALDEGETLSVIARMLERQPSSVYRVANRTSGIARLPARSADGLGQHLHCHADGAALALCDAGQGGAQGHGKRGARADKAGQQTAGKTASVVAWDRGTEMASHRNFSIAADVQVYFLIRTAHGSESAMRTRMAFCDGPRQTLQFTNPPKNWRKLWVLHPPVESIGAAPHRRQR
jgi:hypothetical protein